MYVECVLQIGNKKRNSLEEHFFALVANLSHTYHSAHVKYKRGDHNYW